MTDSEFNGLINSRQFTELFVAESRAGNGSLSSAERELGINQPVLPVIGGGLPFPGAQGQFAWGSNQPVDFVLSYDLTFPAKSSSRYQTRVVDDEVALVKVSRLYAGRIP